MNGGGPLQDLDAMIRGLEPRLHDGVFAYVVLNLDESPPAGSIATFREAEGLTVILDDARAIGLNLPILFRASWITLDVHSALDAVGLTAAVSRALAEAAISCNLIAGAHHDHIFVPVDQATNAMTVLRALQNRRVP